MIFENSTLEELDYFTSRYYRHAYLAGKLANNNELNDGVRSRFFSTYLSLSIKFDHVVMRYKELAPNERFGEINKLTNLYTWWKRYFNREEEC